MGKGKSKHKVHISDGILADYRERRAPYTCDIVEELTDEKGEYIEDANAYTVILGIAKEAGLSPVDIMGMRVIQWQGPGGGHPFMEIEFVSFETEAKWLWHYDMCHEAPDQAYVWLADMGIEDDRVDDVLHGDGELSKYETRVYNTMVLLKGSKAAA
jgi:hypothetical protein